MYGRPETWDGFWYVVLAEQFRGSVLDPFGNLGGKVLTLAVRATGQFGPLTPLIPIAFVATVVRRPRYALLTGSAAFITCFFAASYVNADIGRYYLVPWLMVWTWLAILGAFVAAVLANLLAGSRNLLATPTTPRFRRTATVVAVGFAAILIAPTVVALPTRYRAVNESGDRSAAGWVDRALQVMAPMPSSSAGGVTPRRYGMHSASRVDGRT